ncbi:hypothetical protein GCM10020295_51660 [Streptomyces cinereospinus]
MPGTFEPLPGGGAAVALDNVEISIIRSLAVQLLELIGPGPGADAPDDPLAELFAEGPSEPPPTRCCGACSRTPTATPGGRRRTRGSGRTPPSSAGTPRTTCGPASGRTPWR